MDQVNMAKIHHDDYKDSKSNHLRAVDFEATREANVVTDCPFNAAELVKNLELRGHQVKQILVTGFLHKIKERYKARAGKEYPKNFETNHGRYHNELNRFVFAGTSDQVLEYLNKLEANQRDGN